MLPSPYLKFTQLPPSLQTELRKSWIINAAANCRCEMRNLNWMSAHSLLDDLHGLFRICRGGNWRNILCALLFPKWLFRRSLICLRPAFHTKRFASSSQTCLTIATPSVSSHAANFLEVSPALSRTMKILASMFIRTDSMNTTALPKPRRPF